MPSLATQLRSADRDRRPPMILDLFHPTRRTIEAPVHALLASPLVVYEPVEGVLHHERGRYWRHFTRFTYSFLANKPAGIARTHTLTAPFCAQSGCP